MRVSASEALSAALAAEHAAIFAYGPIGVRLIERDRARARAAEAEHRNRRDALVMMLSATGAPVPAAAAAYALPFRVTDKASALRLATQVEDRTAAAWRAVLPATTGDQRKEALAALTDAAVRATRWRRSAKVSPATVAFPGRVSS